MYDTTNSPSPSAPVFASFPGASGPEWLAPIASLAEMGIQYEAKDRILWQFMRPQSKPSITRGLLRDALTVMDAVAAAPSDVNGHPVAYMVLASAVKGIYNLGGDLALFHQLILDRNKDALTEYAHTCH